jgi:hypothetical protein
LVLGLDPDVVQEEVRLAGERQRQGGATTMAASAGDSEGDAPETVMLMGREITVPEGLTKAQIEAVAAKMQGPNGFQSLSAADRQILSQLRGAGGQGGRGGRERGGNREAQRSTTAGLFGGNYIVFVIRDGKMTAVPVRTGLTDLDYSEVISGLTVADTVLLLPSASLLRSQAAFTERIERMTGGNNPLGGGRR